MVKKIINRVTVTGADDSIQPKELIQIAKEYPFVEFGILLSKQQQGNKRFPSRNWLNELYIEWRNNKKLALSGHLCGAWVRNLCVGMPNFFQEFGCTWKMFDRFQLNFHAEPHVASEGFSEVLREYMGSRQIIFQMDGVNEKIFSAIENRWGIYAYPLFDTSGGVGVLPKAWPKQYTYCGYAGGLSPDNLQQELEKIAQVADGPIWIDAETHLRSQDDMLFDQVKVRRFLEVAKPWVIDQK